MKCPNCGYELRRQSRESIPQETLEKATGNLCYVVWMLNKMPTLIFKPNSQPENNAFIESFVIHARILIEFLHGDERNDTFFASDYCSNWKRPLKEEDFLLEIKRKANKMGAHLTATGVMMDNKDWPVIEIRDKLNKEIEEFLDDENTKITEEKKKAIKKIMKSQIQFMGVTCPTGPAEPFKN